MKSFLKDESGQDLIEYALLLVFLALAVITALPVLGQAVSNVFNKTKSSLTPGVNPGPTPFGS
jgi:pilus assembly protein Flp/PilA